MTDVDINGWCKRNVPFTSCAACMKDLQKDLVTPKELQELADTARELSSYPFPFPHSPYVAVSRKALQNLLAAFAVKSQQLFNLEQQQGALSAAAQVAQKLMPQTPPAPQRPTIGRVLHITEYRETGFGKHETAIIFPAIVYRVTDDQMDVAAFSPEACGIQLKGLHPTEPGLITLIEHTDGVHHSYSWDWPPRAS